MENNRKILATALLAVATATPALAIPIVEVRFGDPTVEVSQTVDAHVFVTNLDDELVGAYDLTLAWNPSLLAFNGIVFDVFLDGPDFSLRDFVPATGALNVWEISLDFLANQTGFAPFRLFTATFDTLSAGPANLALDWASPQFLSDEMGAPHQFLTTSGYVSIVAPEPPTAVPEPPTAWLLAAGALLALGWRWDRRASSNRSRALAEGLLCCRPN